MSQQILDYLIVYLVFLNISELLVVSNAQVSQSKYYIF